MKLFQRVLLSSAMLGTTLLSPVAYADTSIGSPTAATFYLPMKHQDEAEALARDMQTPGSSHFHKFISRQEFVTRFADSDAEIAKVKAKLAAQGYTVTYVFANHLAVEAVASSSSSSTRNAAMTRMSADGAALPAGVSDVAYGMADSTVRTIRARPHMKHAALMMPTKQASGGAITLNPVGPGNYLPSFFEQRYGISELHKLGLYGQGQTVGILTLAPVEPADAYQFWKLLGLKVASDRLSVVSVDGGQSITDAGGTGESDLDTEESGSIAPAAKMRVYVGNNTTEAGFSNGFEAVASDNIVDTVSVSWGSAEVYEHAFTHAGYQSSLFTVRAAHEAMLEMALQGQSLTVASGDDGSYDAACATTGTPSPSNPVCSLTYTVDWPSSDPLALSAGGTTVPYTATFGTPALTLKVTDERAWAWDYIVSQAAKQGLGAQNPEADYFSTGGGGGVSTLFKRPWYQDGVDGIRPTQPNQVFTYNVGNGVDTVTLPSYYHGRNVPDMVANADPYSGYQYISGGQLQSGWGGTSFVAPLFNGSLSLVAQVFGGRVGQVQPVLYYLQNVAIKDVTRGTNWGFVARAGFDDATGLGTPDLGHLLMAEKALIAQPDESASATKQTEDAVSSGLKADSAR